MNGWRPSRAALATWWLLLCVTGFVTGFGIARALGA